MQVLACSFSLSVILCLLPSGRCSEYIVEPEVDAYVSLLQTKVDVKSGDSPMPVRMTPAEEKLFRKYLARATKYLEWGSGGSTVAALSYPNVKSVQVIESAPAWVKTLQERTDVAAAEREGRLNFHLVDIGELDSSPDSWGFPASTGIDYGFPDVPAGSEAAQRFPKYSSLQDMNLEGPSLVLVDGRFRVACFLQALKHAGPETRIAIHDYTSRPEYHLIERFAVQVESAEDLSIFKAKPSDIDFEIQRYQNVPAL